MGKLPLLCLSVLFTIHAEAQRIYNSLEYARMSGAGPFPRYLTIKGHWHGQHTFNSFLEEYAYDRGVKPRSAMFDLDLNVGSINLLGNKRGFFRNALGLEAGLKIVKGRGTASGDSTLFIHSRAVNFLVKYRMNILYPLTFQITGGPILWNQFTVVTRNGELTRRSFVRGRRFLSGFQFAPKLVIFDPVGTNGGIGFYVEMSILHYYRNGTFEKILKDRFDLAESNKSRVSCGIGIGFLAPLALIRK